MSDSRAARFCARYSSLLWTQDPEDLEIEALGKSRMEAAPKQWGRFRRECEAVGFKPPAYVKPDKREAWWLRIYAMPEEFHDELWGVILDKPRIMAEVFAKESSKWSSKKNAVIARQVEKIQELEDRSKAIARRVRPRRRKRGGESIRPLTSKQAEALHMLGECAGNYTKAARRIGIDRKSFEDRCRAAYGKLGRKGMKLQEIAFNKALVARLPRDGRGQDTVDADDDGPAALENRKPRKVTRNRRG